MLLMNSRISRLKWIVHQSLMITGIVKYNITYIPNLRGYKITLVGSREGMSGDVVSKLIESLSANGFTVWMKVGKFPSYNVINLYVVPKVFPY